MEKIKKSPKQYDRWGGDMCVKVVKPAKKTQNTGKTSKK